MTNKQIMEQLATINNTLVTLSETMVSLNSRIESLENSSTKKSPKPTTKKSTTKKSTTSRSTKSTDSLAQFEPKKDADGHYNYKSWKTCRAKYVATLSGKKDEWIDYAEFCKLAKPFDTKYPYVKKSDR